MHGYKEEGTTTTPFDMVVQNDLDRFHLFADAVTRLPQLAAHAADVQQFVRNKLTEHKSYIEEHGQDLPEILGWRWKPSPTPISLAARPNN